ncbi:MAG: SUMF1/EgtB/PvdO family nonheme iron enzyme [Pirellulaceae bacterium]
MHHSDPFNPSDFPSLQFVTPWSEHWLGPSNWLWRYARDLRGRVPEPVIKEHLCPLLFDKQLHETLRSHYDEVCSEQIRDDPSIPRRGVWLLQGQVYGILAARAAAELLAGNAKPSVRRDFDRFSRACIRRYQRAWPVDSEPMPNTREQGSTFREHKPHPLAALLAPLAMQRPLSTLGWLTLRRILGYVLGFDEPGGEVYAARAPMLLVHPLMGSGDVRSAEILVEPSDVFGCYLDPIALGLSAVDENMVTSLRRAWRLCRAAVLGSIQPGEGVVPSIRLAPDTRGIALLGGDSAGALLACGIFAAANARREPLDGDASISAAIIDDDGKLGPVDGVEEKLQAAQRHHLQRVVLESDQAAQFQETGRRLGIQVLAAATLAEAFGWLNTDARMEQVLAKYGEARQDEWERVRGDWRDVDQLAYYVEPHYGWRSDTRQPLTDSSDRSGGVDDEGENPKPVEFLPVADPEDTAEDELAKLVAGSRLICLTEDAGAGKTIFTRRLEAYLCGGHARERLFGGRPHLGIRFEHRVKHWPTDFFGALRAELAKSLEAACKASGNQVAPQDVAEWAVSRGRLVLILDALDQVNDDARTNSLQEFLNANQQAEHPCRVVLTSRAYAVNDRANTLFHVTGWRFAVIRGFDIFQQYVHLRGPSSAGAKPLVPAVADPMDERQVRGALATLFHQYKDVSDLLQIPVVLSLVRRLADRGRLQPFRTRGELYAQVHVDLLKRAAEKLGHRGSPGQLARWQELIAASAFQMAVDGRFDYTVQGTAQVAALQRKAGDRCARPVSDQEWKDIEEFGEFTYRCILERADELSFGFKHRGMLEFYAALHLATNGQTGWIREVRDNRGELQSLTCGESTLARHVSDKNWYWIWRFATELPNQTIAGHERTLTASLSELFRLREGQHRPTELIFRAWHRFELDVLLLRQMGPHDSAHRATVHDRQLLELGRGHILPDAAVVVREYRSVWGGDGKSKSKSPAVNELLTSFIRCPPQGVSFASPIGSDERQVDERPRHIVIVPAFELQRTPVTRRQFALFDPQWEIANRSLLNAYCRSSRCPAISISWFDAFAFCKSLGPEYGLPTEVEWECACRAGFAGDYWFAEEGDLDKHVWHYGNSQNRTHPVDADDHANAWGISDMLGNVWEWCWDWYDRDWYRQRTATSEQTVYKADSGPAAGSWRVRRGGSFYDLYFVPRSCRSSYRSFSDPTNHGSSDGFRVCRRGGSPQSSS